VLAQIEGEEMLATYTLWKLKRWRVAIAAITGALAFLVAMNLTGSSSAAEPKPTVVLVHGAFADASGWDRVVQKLQKNGYPVIASANPLRGVATDAAYLASLLESTDGPIILAGHSYGGFVMTNAATGNANVKALVYIAAFAPDEGDIVFGLAGMFPGSQLPTAIHAVPYELPNGESGIDGYIDVAQFHAVFAGDLPRNTAMAMAASQRPSTLASGEEPSGAPAWESIPSWYMVATDDKVIPPEAQRFMAERAGATTVEVKSSHVAMVSKPAKVVELIEAAAKAVKE
jgi:pimeloyl-ACP methyl ester carboxylesterase